MREHWLEHAHGRIVAGDDELDVLADYGWVQLTDAERGAIGVADQCIQAQRAQRHPEETRACELLDETLATLRSLLERTRPDA
jgi:hypothetical protein